ncbi:MAG: hypothetical protein ACE3JQ_03480 [Paenisporosarcina sp.]
MKKDKLIKTAIDLVGLPFLFANKVTEKKKEVKEPGTLLSGGTYFVVGYRRSWFVFIHTNLS